MTTLETTLARSLAAAVNAEADRLDELCQATGNFNEPPQWFHEATQALSDYYWQEQRDLEKNRINY